MQLTIEDFQLLALLDHNPNITQMELSEVLHLSPYKIKKRLDLLTEWNILRPPIARYDPNTLGLERYNILIQLSSIKTLEILEKAGDIHPYTHYRSRFYGDGLGMFLQYDIPTGNSSKLMKWLNLLQDQLEFSMVTIDKSTGIRIETHPRLDQWLLNHFRWEFDWKEWKKTSEEIDDTKPLTSIQRPNVISQLDKLDIQILSELNNNARAPLSILSRKLGRSKADLSRRISFLKKHVIYDLRVQYDRKIFDLTNVKLIYIPRNPENEKPLRRLYHSLEKHPIPFRLAMNVGKQYAWLWLIFPPYHEAEFVYTLFDTFSELKILTIDVIGKHGILYPIYPENYDIEKKFWRIDDEWMILSPLEQLKLEQLKKEMR